MGLFSGSASLVPKPHTLNSLAQKMADNEILSLFAGFHYCQDTWPPFSIRGEKKLAHDDLIDQDSKWKLIQCSFALLFVLTRLLEWEWGPRRLIDSSQFPVMEKKHFCAMCEVASTLFGQRGCQTWYTEDLLVQNFKIHSIVVSRWYFGFECVQFFQVQSWSVFFNFLFWLFFLQEIWTSFHCFFRKGKTHFVSIS